MSGPEHDPSVHSEPHFQKESFTPDQAEEKAARRLVGKRASMDPDMERAKHSVFDELATFPHRPSVLIDRDWPCRNCGYNLRGLMTGHPCPECGQIERYEPPREGEQTYLEWLAEHQARPSLVKAWLFAGLIPVLGAPLALGCALITVERLGVLWFVVFGPAMSEALKVAVAAMLIERRSAMIRSAAQIHFMSLGTAVVFAVVQNLAYLLTYLKNAPIEVLAYRWFVCVILHTSCTFIATRDLVPVWEQTQQRRREVSISSAYPAITIAIVLHACYNAFILLNHHSGYGF